MATGIVESKSRREGEGVTVKRGGTGRGGVAEDANLGVAYAVQIPWGLVFGLGMQGRATSQNKWQR